MPRRRTTFGEMFERIGGLVHPAEDEIAACAFALGASYAGKCAVSLTSGAGYALKQQPLIDLAVKAEVPLVVIQLQGRVQHGEPTKVNPAACWPPCSAARATRPRW
jgi:2-oxoglutarate ferredoxin oxidoreductase subunit alpha